MSVPAEAFCKLFVPATEGTLAKGAAIEPFSRRHVISAGFEREFAMKNAAVCVVTLSSLALCVGALGVAALSLPALADPRVGVTSATTGGPTAKPPAPAERAVPVGLDVHANAIVT